MITLDIKGTSSTKKKELIREAIMFSMKELMPRKQILHIDVIVQKMKDVDGYCAPIDKDVFEIELRRNMNTEDLLTTIFHEMVHVKQYSRQELAEDDWGKGRWKDGSRWSYDSLVSPWEKEAYGMQEELLWRWHFDQTGFYS